MNAFLRELGLVFMAEARDLASQACRPPPSSVSQHWIPQHPLAQFSRIHGEWVLRV